jgi:hypothetical protein
VKVVSCRHLEVNKIGKVQGLSANRVKITVKFHPEYNFYKMDLLNIRRNYEFAKSQYGRCIDEGSEMFVKEVNKAAAYRRMKTHHAGIHQILSDLQYFKAFKTGTIRLRDEARTGAVSYWTNSDLQPHEKRTMVSVLSGLSGVLQLEQPATAAASREPENPQETTETDNQIIELNQTNADLEARNSNLSKLLDNMLEPPHKQYYHRYIPRLTKVTNWETKIESIILCHQDKLDKKPEAKTTTTPEESQESVRGPDTTKNP